MRLGDTLGSLYKKIPPTVKLSIAATFTAGLLGNLYIFTNQAINHDDIMAEFIYNKSLDIASGRFMWLIIRKITTYYDMPMLFGLFGMAALALAAGMMVYLLRIREPVYALLISFLLATFPINACYYSYLSISPIYYFAILTAVLGVFLVERIGKLWGILPAAFCIMMSLGTYQSFLSLTVGLVFIMAYIEVYQDEWEFKRWFVRYAKYACTALLGYLLYYVATKMVLFVTGEHLRPYAGTDKMFSLDLYEMLRSVKTTYVSQYEYYLTGQAVTSRGFIWLNTVILAVLVIAAAVMSVRLARKNKWLQTAAVIVMLLTAPFFLNIIYFMMNGKSSVHMLMKYALVLPYILVLALLCRACAKIFSGKLSLCYAAEWIVFLCSVGIIYYGILTSNQLYSRMTYNTNAVDAFCVQLVTRITMQEGYTTGEAIYFAGFNSFFNEKYVTTATFTEDLQPFVWMGTDVYSGWYSSGHLIRYIDFKHHIRLVASNNREREEKVRATQEYQNMPVYPDAGSIQRIEGLLTVKFAQD